MLIQNFYEHIYGAKILIMLAKHLDFFQKKKNHLIIRVKILSNFIRSDADPVFWKSGKDGPGSTTLSGRVSKNNLSCVGGCGISLYFGLIFGENNFRYVRIWKCLK